MKLERIRPDLFLEAPQWRLLEDLTIAGHTIQAGFISDGLSIPWFLRSMFSPTGRGFRAAVLHDYLLQNSKLTRYECAKEFEKVLKESEVSLPIRKIYYLGVRVWDLTK